MEFHQNDLSDLDELTEEHLGFSALSDGLGFSRNKKKSAPARIEKEVEEDFDRPEPALAPQAQKPFSGAGAVAAGPARPVIGPSPFTFTSSKSAPSAASQVLAAPAAPRKIRVAAFLLDAALILIPFAAAWMISFGSDSAAVFLQDPRPPLGLFAVTFLVYFLLSESFGGQSLGKMMLGLRVVEDDKYQKPIGFRHALGRILLLIAGTVFLGLGLLASFRDSKRRPWHDRYSGSIVRRIA